MLQATHPSLRVESHVFPAYETRGELVSLRLVKRADTSNKQSKHLSIGSLASLSDLNAIMEKVVELVKQRSF